jgi:hypothetical protein
MKLSPDHDGKKQPPKKVQNPTDNDSFNLKQINPNAAGIDLGSGEHSVDHKLFPKGRSPTN